MNVDLNSIIYIISIIKLYYFKFIYIFGIKLKLMKLVLASLSSSS